MNFFKLELLETSVPKLKISDVRLSETDPLLKLLGISSNLTMNFHRILEI